MKKFRSRTLKIAGVAKKLAFFVTMDFWLEAKELLPKESTYKFSYPYSLEDKTKFIMLLVK